MFMLVALPDGILLDFFSLFCGIKDLAYLDLSVCNKKQRVLLLGVFSSPIFALNDEISLSSFRINSPGATKLRECAFSFYNWFIERKLKSTCFHFESSIFRVYSIDMIDCSHIRNLKMRIEKDDVNEIQLSGFINRCVALTVLEITLLTHKYCSLIANIDTNIMLKLTTFKMHSSILRHRKYAVQKFIFNSSLNPCLTTVDIKMYKEKTFESEYCKLIQNNPQLTDISLVGSTLTETLLVFVREHCVSLRKFNASPLILSNFIEVVELFRSFPSIECCNLCHEHSYLHYYKHDNVVGKKLSIGMWPVYIINSTSYTSLFEVITDLKCFELHCRHSHMLLGLIAVNNHDLIDIRISFLDDLHVDNIIFLLKSCNKLKYIMLSDSYALSTSYLVEIFATPSSIKRVDLNKIYGIDYKTIIDILNFNVEIEFLKVTNCSINEDKLRSYLVEKKRHLQLSVVH